MIRSDGAMAFPEVVIRDGGPADRPQLAWLYAHGLLVRVPTADLAPLDFLSSGGSADHLWVAESGGRLVGMIAVKHEPGGVARVRHLRVDRRWQSTNLADRLIDAALDHSRTNGDVKVILDTHVRAEEARAHLEHRGFRHARSRRIAGRDRMEFYVDIYHRVEGPRDHGTEGWRAVSAALISSR